MMKAMMPFTPHLSCECLTFLEGKNFYSKIEWPKIQKSLLADEKVTIVIQVNGKKRGLISNLEPRKSRLNRPAVANVTLMAVCIYFRSDLIEMVNSIIKHKSLFNNLLLRQLFISCIPTLFLGFILIDLIDGYLRTSTVIATTTIFFGFVLFLATFSKSHKIHIE